MDVVIFTTYESGNYVRERRLAHHLSVAGVRCRLVRIGAPSAPGTSIDGVVQLPRDAGSPDGQHARSDAFLEWVRAERPDWILARGNKIDLLYDVPDRPGLRRGVIIGGGHRDARLGRLDLAFVESHAQIRAMGRRWPLLPTMILPKYVPPPFFAPPPSDRDTDVIGVGRQDTNKDYSALIPLFASTHRVHLVGDGPEHERIRAAAAGRPLVGLTRRATQDEVADLLRRSRVLAHPARREGLPRAVCEAMAAGCVPIHRRTAIDSRVLDPTNSVACEDTTALLRAIEGALSDEERLRSLSERARSTARAKFSDDALGRAAELLVRLLAAPLPRRWWMGRLEGRSAGIGTGAAER